MLSILLFSSYSPAECPSWFKTHQNELPMCPSGQNIPETYPVGAVVVSDHPNRPSKSSSGFTRIFAKKVFAASEPLIPLVLLPVSDQTMKEIRDSISGDEAYTPEQKQRYLKALVQVPARGYTWQQDYFQATVDQNGLPVLHEVKNYFESRNDHDAKDVFRILAQTAGDCGIKTGPVLNTPDGKHGGTGGGNLQTLPGGICAVGDDQFDNEKQWADYADQFCNSDPKFRFKPPTSWLDVGHTDEILKVVRNKNKSSPCDFSFVVPSPKKAIELLQKKPEDTFLDGAGADLERYQNDSGLQALCSSFLDESTDQPQPNPPRSSPSRGRATSDFFRFRFFGFLTQRAYGFSYPPDMCLDMKNKDIVLALSPDSDLGRYNALIQKKIDQMKKDLELKYRALYPQCTLDFIDAPNLFFGGSPVKKEGRSDEELPEHLGRSILPDTVNSVSINDTILSPEPNSSVFKEDLIRSYKERGLKTDFIDAFDYAHEGLGELHCSTHTLHVCRSNGEQK